MTSKERVMAVLKGEAVDKVPYIEFMNPGIMAELKKHYGLNEKDTIGLYRRMGMDAMNFDGCCSPLFAEGEYDESNVFVPTKPLIATSDDLHKMVFPNWKDPSFFDEAKRFLDEYGSTDLALFAGGRLFIIYSVIYSMGFENFAYALMDEPEFLSEMAKRYAEYEIEVYTRLQDLGFDFVMGYNDMAFNTGLFCSMDTINELFLPSMKQVAHELKKKTPIAMHSDGKLTPAYDMLINELKLDALHPFDSNCNDMAEEKKLLKDTVTMWGNVELNILGRGTVEETVDYVKMLLRDVAPQGRYIFADSNCMPDWVKIENVVAMVETFNKYRNYPIKIDS